MSTDLTTEQEEARKPSISPALRREMNDLALGDGCACAVLRPGTKRTGSDQRLIVVKLGRGTTGKAPRRAVQIAAIRDVGKLSRSKKWLARKERELRKLFAARQEVAS